ncbi:hypothetical protein ES702_02143 [subsurface metagenome]
MKDYAKYWNSISDKKKERFFARMFKVAYRDSIDEMSADEIKKKTKEFRVKWLNTELDDESVDKMFALMADSQELEKKKPELYDVCMNHSLKECDFDCGCEYIIIMNGILNNLIKTVDLVRKAKLRHVE